MLERIEDRNLTGIRPLPPPRALKRRLPISEAAADSVRAGRAGVREAIHGRDDHRLVVIVGPCSIHDPEAALEYAERLRRAAEPLREHLHVVMRTYFEKPRTTVGWKGLVNDPHLDDSCNVEAGLELARSLLLRINELGVPCATEVLDPFTPQYLADLLSGDLAAALNAMVSARHPHSFLGITADGVSAVVSTRGNPDRHLVLRGGAAGPNYDAESVARAAARVDGEDLARPVMIDCSHGNSRKDAAQQASVCRAVLDQVRSGQKAVLGVMLESNLEAGSQAWSPGRRLVRGLSITDACIGWGETEDLLNEIAEAIKLSP
jgi:3-deoxy-7-phosphoheptulonate synthase